MKNNFSIRKKTISYKKHIGGGDDEDVPSANVGQIVASDSGVDSDLGQLNVASTIDQPNSSNQQLDFMEPSRLTLYTIPQGTELYHGSIDLDKFDTARINIGKDSLVAFFSPNKDFAASYINECASGKGYIHKFVVNKQIDKIYILSPHDKNLNWNEKTIENKFCKGGEFGKMNGVGFFVPNQVKERFTETNNSSQGSFSSEFALCDPSQYLTYLGTYNCSGARTLSKNLIRFDE